MPTTTLIHTRLQIPEPHPEVTAVSQLELARGVAFVAAAQLGGRRIGTFENDGQGGPTEFLAADPDTFGPEHLAALAAQCLHDGEPVTADELMDLLIEEHDSIQAVTGFPAHESTVARLLSHGYTAAYDFIPIPATAQHSARTAEALAQAHPGATGTWQRWTGQNWEPLTAPENPDPAAHPAPRP